MQRERAEPALQQEEAVVAIEELAGAALEEKWTTSLVPGRNEEEN